jgi:hypothetical protein
MGGAPKDDSIDPPEGRIFVAPHHQNYLVIETACTPVLCVTRWHRTAAIDWLRISRGGSVMERLPDFIRARLWQLAQSKPPPKRLLTVLRELAQEYKVVLSDDAARHSRGAEND